MNHSSSDSKLEVTVSVILKIASRLLRISTRLWTVGACNYCICNSFGVKIIGT